MTYIPGGGSTDSRFVTFGQNVGNGSAGPYTVTHSLGTQALFGLVRDNLTGQQTIIDVRPNPAARLSQAIVDTSETWGTNAKHLTILGVLGVGDVTPPSQPTITFVSKTDTTISVSASATDNVGVSYYDYYVGTTKVGAAQGASYTYTGLTQLTAYANLNVIATDIEGNASVASANLASVTTNATPQVTQQAIGTPGRNTTAATPISQTASVTVPASLTNSIALVPVTLSHLNWLTFTAGGTGAGSIVLTSSTGQTYTQVGFQYQGNSTQQTGEAMWFYRLNPTAGATTFTATATSPSATTVDEIDIGAPLVYSGVASVGTAVTQNTTAANGAVSVSVPSQVGDKIVVLVGASAAVTGLTGTNISNQGSAINGTCDYTYVQEVAGAAGSVSISSSSSAHQVVVSAIDLVKA